MFKHRGVSAPRVHVFYTDMLAFWRFEHASHVENGFVLYPNGDCSVWYHCPDQPGAWLGLYLRPDIGWNSRAVGSYEPRRTPPAPACSAHPVRQSDTWVCRPYACVSAVKVADLSTGYAQARACQVGDAAPQDGLMWTHSTNTAGSAAAPPATSMDLLPAGFTPAASDLHTAVYDNENIVG